MAEPIPSASPAATAAVEDESTPSLPANAEDRKAAAALNALNTNDMSAADSGSGSSNGKKSVASAAADREALDKAMSRLEMVVGGGGGAGSGKGKKEQDAAKKKAEDAKRDGEMRKKIKVGAEDVAFLMTELDVSKTKATELLRASEGDAGRAVRTFIRPAVRVS